VATLIVLPSDVGGSALTADRTTAPQTLARAEELAGQGRFLEALTCLEVVAAGGGDVEVERRLLRLRHLAFEELAAEAVQGPWPEDDREVPTDDEGLAVVRGDGAAPSAAVVRSAIVQHGHLLVRSLLSPDRVAHLVAATDRAFEAFDAHAGGRPVEETTPWFEPFIPAPQFSALRHNLEPRRNQARDAGSVWIADSPRLLCELVATLTEVGLDDVVATYLGERPALSVKKCNVRRVPLDTLYADWHQDGAFLGEGIRTLNVWISLSRCGRDSPGLDLLPKRVELVETGTEGSMFPWSTARAVVERVSGGTPIVRPEFEPGDVLLFDERFLHRTACEPGMTHERYAIESWFFAPSSYPARSLPLVY
jgi:hypothetical protein